SPEISTLPPRRSSDLSYRHSRIIGGRDQALDRRDRGQRRPAAAAIDRTDGRQPRGVTDVAARAVDRTDGRQRRFAAAAIDRADRSEEHTAELQSRFDI